MFSSVTFGLVSSIVLVSSIHLANTSTGSRPQRGSDPPLGDEYPSDKAGLVSLVYLDGENLKDGSVYLGIGLPTDEGDLVGGDSEDFLAAVVVSNGINEGDLADGDWGWTNTAEAGDSFFSAGVGAESDTEVSDFFTRLSLAGFVGTAAALLASLTGILEPFGDPGTVRRRSSLGFSMSALQRWHDNC